MSKVHKDEIVRWANSPEGTKVWYKRLYNSKWVLCSYASWRSNYTYIVNDRQSEDRKKLADGTAFYVEVSFCDNDVWTVKLDRKKSNHKKLHGEIIHSKSDSRLIGNIMNSDITPDLGFKVVEYKRPHRQIGLDDLLKAITYCKVMVANNLDNADKYFVDFSPYHTKYIVRSHKSIGYIGIPYIKDKEDAYKVASYLNKKYNLG